MIPIGIRRRMSVECQSCGLISSHIKYINESIKCPDCTSKTKEVWIKPPHRRFFSKFTDGDYQPKRIVTDRGQRQLEKNGKRDKKIRITKDWT